MANKEINYLKVLLLGQLTVEAIEDIQDTIKYKHNLKNQGNKFLKMLEDYVKDDYNTLYLNDEELTSNILRKLSELISKLNTVSINELVLIDSIIDNYLENKEFYNENMPINFLKIDK